MGELGVELEPLARTQLVLARLLGVEAQRRRPRAAPRRSARATAPAVSVARRWVSTDATRLTARPRAPRPRGPPPRPARPASASHANVSRLPAGPGSPEDAKPSTAAPADRAHAATATSASRRSAGSRHDAALPDPLAADLELRLDHDQRVEPLRDARQHGRQHLRERDERHVGDDEVGPVGQRVRASAPGRSSARSPSRADRRAARAPAPRRRRRARRRAPRPAAAGSP